MPRGNKKRGFCLISNVYSMKQHITHLQLNELPDKAKEILFSWQLQKGYTNYGEDFQDEAGIHTEIDMPLLSIGQMIEFLEWEANPTFLNTFAEVYTRKKHHEPDLSIVDDLWRLTRAKLCES